MENEDPKYRVTEDRQRRHYCGRGHTDRSRPQIFQHYYCLCPRKPAAYRLAKVAFNDCRSFTGLSLAASRFYRRRVDGLRWLVAEVQKVEKVDIQESIPYDFVRRDF